MGVRGVGAAAVIALAGCSSVKLAQRDGCWVRRTERAGNVKEELGPCARPPTPWSEDRLTRLVQECVAGDDHRWQTRAVAAWSRGEPLPEKVDEDAVLQRCMADAARASLTHEENEGLKQRLAEVTGDRDALRTAADTTAKEERQHLTASNDRLAEFLGDAAKKPNPPATATATATSEGRMESDGAPQATLAAAPATPAAPITITAQGGAGPPAAASPAPVQPAALLPAPGAGEAACATPAPRRARSGKGARGHAPLVPCTPAGDSAKPVEPAAKPADVTPAVAAPPAFGATSP